MNARYPAAYLDEVRERVPLAAVVGRKVHLRREGRVLTGRCPFHPEKTPSFTVYDTSGDRRFHCFGCGAHGDALDFLQRADGMSFLDAVEYLSTEAGMTAPKAGHIPLASKATVESAPEPPPSLPAQRWSPKAGRIWNMAGPTDHPILRTYLEETRGCVMPRGADLRFIPAGPRTEWPTMVARVTDLVTGEPMSLHFTRLAKDGRGKAPVDKPRLLLAEHQKTGGVIRLTDDADVIQGLGIGEGLETCLAVAASGWRPVWSAIDAGNLAALPVVAGIEFLTIFADADPAGEKGAKALARRWHEAGREARIVAPPTAGADWNDVGRAA